MNYYRRFPGDYANDTRHLNFAEHGAYCLLLDLYYASEKPLPGDRQEIYRKTCARMPEERAAIDAVLSEFFVEQARPRQSRGKSVFMHRRVEREIKLYRELSKRNRINGLRGGRPKTQKKPTGLRLGSENNPIQNQNQSQSQPSPELQFPQVLEAKPLIKPLRAAKSAALPWPDGFALKPEMREYASKRGVLDADREFEAFHDWALAHGRTYKNWEAAWRTRVNNFHKFGGNGNGTGRSNHLERTRRTLETARELLANVGEGAHEMLPALSARFKPS
jgi:uncharacterized protein YdaU (DUF1376 family)